MNWPFYWPARRWWMRRRYTKQKPRRYFPRSEWDNEVGSYSEELPMPAPGKVYSTAFADLPRRCYYVRGLSLHSAQGRAYLLSDLALRAPENGVPLAREFPMWCEQACIPPIAMRLLMLKIGAPMPVASAAAVEREVLRADAALLIALVSVPRPLDWLYALWTICRPRRMRAFLRAVPLLRGAPFMRGRLPH